MITITKNGNAVLFEFEENQHYLYNGTIEVPLNSLSLVTDESEMFTFKKAATNDIFISARYDDVNMSKSQLIDFYIANMVGSGNSESGITSGDVQTMIDTSLEDYYDIDEIDAALSGKADSSAVTESINAAVSGKQDTLIAGSGITISGNVISAEGGNLVIELTQAEYDALVDKDPNAFYIITDATEINISDYYTSAQTQSAINAAVSGKADTSSVYTKSEVDTALGGKQATLVSGTNIKTINNESILGSGNIDIQGGGSSYTAGRGISIENNEISFNLPISAGTGSNSIICGNNGNKASGSFSFAGGQESSATSFWSFAYGANCKSGYGAWAGGFQCQANGSYGFAIGERTRTSNDSECSIGHYNVTNAGSTNDLKTLFSVGNGTADNARHNAFEIRQNGDIYITKDGQDVKLQDQLGGGVTESAFTSYSAATDARISEDEEVTAAALNTLNDNFDGLRLKKLTQAEYEALTVKDNNTLYILVG